MIELKNKKTKMSYKAVKEKYGDEYWKEGDFSPLDSHKLRLAYMVESWGDAVLRRAPRMNWNCIYQLCKEGFLGLDELPDDHFKQTIDNIWKCDLKGEWIEFDPVKAAYGI